MNRKKAWQWNRWQKISNNWWKWEKPHRGDEAARRMNTSESVFFPSLAQL
jgi:hypothetical protein